MKKKQLLVVLFNLIVCFALKSNTYSVTNNKDAGAGSLRQAVINCNNNAGIDYIDFKINSTDTIKLDSTLNVISETIILNGASLNNKKVVIKAKTNNFTCFTIYNANKTKLTNCEFKNIQIVNFYQGIYCSANLTGLKIKNSDFANNSYSVNCYSNNKDSIISNTFSNDNYALQIANDTNSILKNNRIINCLSKGIYIYSSQNTVIETNKITNSNIGIELGTNKKVVFNKNIIYGSGTDAITIGGSTDSCIIKNNFIGFDSTETLNNKLQNNGYGIKLQNSGQNYLQILNNVIGNSIKSGIYAQNNLPIILKGNYIGISPQKKSIANLEHGIDVFHGSNMSIGGIGSGEGNIIANNGMNGVNIEYGSTDKINLLRNSIFNNGTKAINTHFYDGGTYFYGGNNNKKIGYISKVSYKNNIYTIEVNTDTADIKVELFSSDGNNQNAIEYLTEQTVRSSPGIFKISYPSSVATLKFVITTTGKSQNTSELGFNLNTCLNVSNNLDDGPGSLRAAIGCANLISDTSIITFNIDTTGKTINLKTALPKIKYSTYIEGQVGVVVDGSLTSSQNGIEFSESNQTANKYILKVKNLTIRKFDVGIKTTTTVKAIFDNLTIRKSTNEGIYVLYNRDSTIISNCSFDSNKTAINVYSVYNKAIVNTNRIDKNNSGIILGDNSFTSSTTVQNNQITNCTNGNGITLDLTGPVDIKFNTVAGCAKNAISMVRSAETKLYGNTIGIYNGDTLANQQSGIYASFTSKITLDSNIICVNKEYGVSIDKADIYISNNYIGTTPQGDAYGNKKDGVLGMPGSNIYMSPSDLSKANIIGNNGGYGINAQYASVKNNYIGLDKNYKKLPNANSGIKIINITDTISGNYIGNNQAHGIELIGSSFPIQNNFIGGKDSIDFGNTGYGIYGNGASSKIISNQISRNKRGGLGFQYINNSKIIKNYFFLNDSSAINCSTTTTTTLSSNSYIFNNTLIGSESNKNYGMLINGYFNKNKIDSNIISGYTNGGIKIIKGYANVISKNYISTNSKSIDIISGKGNNTRKTPVLKNISLQNSGYIRLNGQSKANDTIEVFISQKTNESLEKYLTRFVVTDSIWEKDMVLPKISVKDTIYLRITATSSVDGTSEVSESVGICPECRCIVTNTKDAGSGSLRSAITCANYNNDFSVIEFEITDTTKVIKPIYQLPEIIYDTYIDGKNEIVIDGVDKSPTTSEGLLFMPNSTDSIVNKLEVKNLTIKNFHENISGSEKIFIDNVKFIKGNLFKNIQTAGLYVYNGIDSIIVKNSVFDSVSLQIFNSNGKCLIEKNTLNSFNGIFNSNFTSCNITNNTYKNFKSSFIFSNSGNLNFSENTLGNATAFKVIDINNSKNIIISKNKLGINSTLTDSLPINGIGISISNNKYVLIDSNIIGYCNGSAVTCSANDTCFIQKNYIGININDSKIPIFGYGIEIDYKKPQFCLIGNSTIDYGNVIGNCGKGGIYVKNDANITNNFIGISKKLNLNSNAKFGIYAPNVTFNPERIFQNNIISCESGIGLYISNNCNIINNNIGTYLNKPLLNTYGIVLAGDSNLIFNNIISNCDSMAIKIIGNHNKSTKNVFINNKIKSIHLQNSGNSNKTIPEINTYKELSDSVLISGISAKNDTVELFVNDSTSQNALRYITSVKTNNVGFWSVKIPSGVAYNTKLANFYIATATDSLSNTSELSKLYYVPKHLCTLNKLNSLPTRSGLCYNESVSYTAPELIKAQYKWLKNDTLLSANKSITIAKSGKYISEVTDNYGCVTKDTIQVEANPLPLVADFLVSSTVYQNEPIVIIDISYTIPDSIVFDFGKNATFTKDSVYYYVTYSDTGSKKIILTSQNGYCSKTITRDIKVLPERTNKARVYNSDFKYLDAYPNPTDGEIKLDIQLFKELDVYATIYDITGSNEIWKHHYLGEASYKESVDLSNFPKGIYFLKVATSSEIRFLQIIIN